MHVKYWLENLKERGHCKDVDLDGMIILEWILKTWGENVWTGFLWIQIQASGRLL
jgi:hypothetical protein